MFMHLRHTHTPKAGSTSTITQLTTNSQYAQPHPVTNTSPAHNFKGAAHLDPRFGQKTVWAGNSYFSILCASTTRKSPQNISSQTHQLATYGFLSMYGAFLLPLQHPSPQPSHSAGLNDLWKTNPTSGKICCIIGSNLFSFWTIICLIFAIYLCLLKLIV